MVKIDLTKKELKLIKEITNFNKPMGPYKDFNSCVQANQDKNDPEGYCAVIMRRVEGNTKDKIIKEFILKQPRDPSKVCGDIWFNGTEDQRSGFEGGTQGRSRDDKPPKKWWDDCINSVSKTNKDLKEKSKDLDSDIMVKTKKEVSIEERVKSLESITKQMASNIKKLIKQEDEKPEDEEDKKPEDKKPDEEEKKKEGVTGESGKITPPSQPEGVDEKLPESVSEKVEDKEPPAETDELKLSSLQKDVEVLKSTLAKFSSAKPTRPGADVKKATGNKEEQLDAYDELKKARKGEKSVLKDLGTINDRIREDYAKEVAKILG